MPDFEWVWPKTEEAVDPKVERWFKKCCVNFKRGNRNKALVIYGRRGTGKSTFIMQMVGHEAGNNCFADNPFVIYICGGATEAAFNKPHARMILFDDFTGWVG